MDRILVAGASGHVGRHLVPMLKEAGYYVRALSRSEESGPADAYVRADVTRPETLADCCRGIDKVISCVGAPVTLGLGQRTSYNEVDFEGNRNLLDQAALAGVKKFVYVSLFGGQQMMKSDYARAHEYFVFALEHSGMKYTVVRPTGYFCTFLSLLNWGRQGKVFVVGDGQAWTNPIHEADVAKRCVKALDHPGADLPCGGPDVLTRREIGALARDVAMGSSAALEKSHGIGRLVPATLKARRGEERVAPFVLTAASKVIKPFHGRMAALLAFASAVSTTDLVAPIRGEQRLRDYFEQHVTAEGPPA